jgi:hypothetical protein
MACPSCGSGMHFECGDPCCCDGVPVAEEYLEHDTADFRGYKRDSTLKDQQSTGRKRAAKLYPLDKESPCEWQGLRFAGGGEFPIVGCTGGFQQSRHHGPDKNTLNNDEGNVHRICHRCHNRWHTRNDAGYIPDNPGKKHDSVTQATANDQIANEVYWTRNKTVKAKD